MNDQELELITAVRNDRVVGRNTCSVIDESYTDAEFTMPNGICTLR